ncbi:MAG: hypothetical protein JRD89_05275 [Deltaproteobacteria bacterium]|nr:hypothetical protein [Deltaproteobacteria bacterium]
MSEEQLDGEILYEVIRKLDAVSSQLRNTPQRFADPVVLNLIGKCFQAGLYVIQYCGKSEDRMKVLEEFRRWHGQISNFIQGEEEGERSVGEEWIAIPEKCESCEERKPECCIVSYREGKRHLEWLCGECANAWSDAYRR